MNKQLTKIIDPTILVKHSLSKTLKSKFTIIWFSTLTIVIIAVIISLNLINQGGVSMLGFNIIITSLLMLLTISIFNIVNLNDLFSNDHELGIMNLELRKGKTKSSIYLSRLLANKIISLGYIILMMCIYLLLTVIINKRDVNLFWMFLTYIPIDFVFTGVFLLFFGFFKYKTSISLSSILLALILITPLMQIVSTMILNNTPRNPQKMGQAYAANKVLSLAYEKDETSFVYKLLNEAQYLNEPLTENNNSKIVQGARELLTVDGLISDMPIILDNFWSQFQLIAKSQDAKPANLEFSEEYKNSFLAVLNNKYSSSEGAYEKEYKNSLYWDNKVTNKNYQKMINNLTSLIQEINKDFQEYQDVQEFNQLVLEYGKGMIFGGTDGTYSEEYWDQDLGWIRYPTFFQQIWSSTQNQVKMGYLEKETLFKHLTIAPELRMWNQITTQLLGSALNYHQDDISNTKSSQIIQAFLNPWTAEFESWFFAKPNLNFYQYLRLDQANFNGGNSLNCYWIYNYPNYLNNTTDQSGPTSFSKLATIVEVTNQSKQEIKVFSVAGFNIVIWSLGMILILISYLFFIKKVKK